VDGTQLQLRERDGVWHKWLPTADLAFRGREDRVFVIDQTAGVSRFGNGETGRIPVCGWQVTQQDLKDPRALAIALRDRPNSVSAWVGALLSPPSASVINSYGGQQPPTGPVLNALLVGMNAAVRSPDLFDAARFKDVRCARKRKSCLQRIHSPELPHTLGSIDGCSTTLIRQHSCKGRSSFRSKWAVVAPATL
jgi:hypothetical protein